jgi:hypothetical protein
VSDVYIKKLKEPVRMSAHLAYGAWYLALLIVDTCLFRWHGIRPVAWQRQFVRHRFRAPHGGEFKSFGTDKERAALKKAQALYPERHMYLGAGADYSPWYGERWCHYVKVLVTDDKGTPPVNKYGDGTGWGMEWDQFLETDWVKNQTCKKQ